MYGNENETLVSAIHLCFMDVVLYNNYYNAELYCMTHGLPSSTENQQTRDHQSSNKRMLADF